jgi:photosystem II stability/assembly factor-like uncharacterized protein
MIMSMPSATSVFMYLVWLTLFGAWAAASAPPDGQERPEPVAGPARRLPGLYRAFEPSVAADPRGRVLIAAINRTQDKWKMYPEPLIAWCSGDRGVTWSEPRSMGSDPVWDVWLQADPRNGFLAAYIQPQGYPKALFRRSEDGGQTWKEARVLGLNADKTVLAVSPSGSRLAVAFIKGPVAAVLRSDDRGEHWQRIPRILAGGAVTPTMTISGLVVNDDGAIVAAWTLRGASAFSPEDPKSAHKLVVSTTKDAGKTWMDLQLASYADAQVMEGGWLWASPGVALALDGSGAAHVVYCYPAGDKKDYRLLYRRSMDLQAWSDPVPLSSGDADNFRGFPAIAAAGDRVHVTWMERSGGLFNVWYRGSADGGKHWSKPLRLSRPERPTDLLTAAGFKEPGGHYMSLAEDGRGTAHAAWGVGQGNSSGEIWHCAVRLRPKEGQAK